MAQPETRSRAAPHGWWLALLLAILLFAAPAAATVDRQDFGAAPQAIDPAAVLEESWYRIEFDERPAGWMHLLAYEDGEHLVTQTTTYFTVRIIHRPWETTLRTRFVETRDHKPVMMMREEETSSVEPARYAWRWEGDEVHLTVRRGERETTRTRPAPEGVWLTPQAAAKFTRQRMQAGATEITFRTVDPESGLEPVQVRLERTGRDEFTHHDDHGEARSIPVTVWQRTTDDVPLPSIEHVSSDYAIVHGEMRSGLGTFHVHLSTREAALASMEQDDDEPAMPIIAASLVEPDRPIENVEDVRRARFRLRVREGRMPPLPTAGAQRVTPDPDGRTAIIEIVLDDPLPAESHEMDPSAYREPSSLIDSDDALIRALARRALRENDVESIGPAEAMRRFVHEYVWNHTLDSVFASASEVARTRRGDCTEHAVLLAAMLRAEGIPARTATGLIYADHFLGRANVFGWHMWTQALIDGRWVDLDATLHEPHAAFILTGTSALADDADRDRDLATMLLMGNLDIEVLEVSASPD